MFSLTTVGTYLFPVTFVFVMPKHLSIRAFLGRTGQARKTTSEHSQHSRAIANSIGGRVGEHPNEKDERTGELYAKENQGGDKCERGTHQILTRCDFDFTMWGYLQSGFNC